MARSGDFTLLEVNILENYGVVLQALANGSQEPTTDAEQRFVDVCQGKMEAESKIEKAWRKYQNKVLTPKQFHTLFGRNKVEVGDDDSPTDPLDLEGD